mgnify:CR=1 FL=1
MQLLDEWKSFQVERDLPPFTLDAADAWWGEVLRKKRSSGDLVYPQVNKIVQILLILPYNQAPVERIFSLVTKIDTKFRHSLKETTLASLIRCKVNLFTN